ATAAASEDLPDDGLDRDPRAVPGHEMTAANHDDDPRFAADCMLGTLAKWLKILGYDTLYLRKAEDAALVARARAEGRILLTRDRRMTERRLARPFLLIRGESALDQLREVIDAAGLRLREDRVLTRCLPCNETTGEVEPERVRDL